jgi:hypothetical protein
MLARIALPPSRVSCEHMAVILRVAELQRLRKVFTVDRCDFSVYASTTVPYPPHPHSIIFRSRDAHLEQKQNPGGKALPRHPVTW